MPTPDPLPKPLRSTWRKLPRMLKWVGLKLLVKKTPMLTIYGLTLSQWLVFINDGITVAEHIQSNPIGFN